MTLVRVPLAPVVSLLAGAELEPAKVRHAGPRVAVLLSALKSAATERRVEVPRFETHVVKLRRRG